MGNADARQVAQMTFHVIDRLQNIRQPGDRVLAAVIIALKVCEQYGVRLPEACDYAARMIYSREGHTESEFRAVQTFIEKEMT